MTCRPGLPPLVAGLLAMASLAACATAPAADAGRTAQEERNLAFVREMYETVLIPMNADAVDDYIAEDYIQHSQFAAPGREALKDFLRMIAVESSDAEQTIHRMFVDGDYVIAHVEVKRFPGDPGLAVADMFRLEDGRIAEHWEVIQDIPTQSPNPLPMF